VKRKKNIKLKPKIEPLNENNNGRKSDLPGGELHGGWFGTG